MCMMLPASVAANGVPVLTVRLVPAAIENVTEPKAIDPAVVAVAAVKLVYGPVRVAPLGQVPAATVPEVTVPRPLSVRVKVCVVPTVGVPPVNVVPSAVVKVMPATLSVPVADDVAAVYAVTPPQIMIWIGLLALNVPLVIAPAELSMKVRQALEGTVMAAALARTAPMAMGKV